MDVEFHRAVQGLQRHTLVVAVDHGPLFLESFMAEKRYTRSVMRQ